nr:unnamed protein product [Spirometra erinaceieuropaei]
MPPLYSCSPPYAPPLNPHPPRPSSSSSPSTASRPSSCSYSLSSSLFLLYFQSFSASLPILLLFTALSCTYFDWIPKATRVTRNARVRVVEVSTVDLAFCPLFERSAVLLLGGRLCGVTRLASSR